jgi:glucokinase
MPDRKPQYILSLDVGGTKLAGALFDSSCRLLRYSRTSTRAGEGAEPVFERLVQLARSLLKRQGLEEHALRCVGVGCAGPLDSETGIVHSPPNLHAWEGFPLKTRLAERLGAPVVVENDANAAALGEHKFGAGQGRRHVFYVTVSTGIGAGLILDGRVYRGADYVAGEFGHTILARGGPKCNCGGRGCLEALASGTAIAKRARREAARAPDSILGRMLAEKKDTLSAKDVAVAARKGDALAGKIFHDAAVCLGLGLTSAIHMLNPEIVIIGGGLTRAGRLLFDPVRRTIAERAQGHFVENMRIVPAKLGGRAGLYGSLADALERCSP